MTIYMLGLIARMQGQRTVARDLFNAGVAAARAASDDLISRESVYGTPAGAQLTYEGLNLYGLASVASDERNYPQARVDAEQALDWWAAAILTRLAQVATRRGEHRVAHVLLEESVALGRRLGSKERLVQALEAFGALAAVEGNPEVALRLAVAATTTRAQIGVPLSPRDRARLESWSAPVREAVQPSLDCSEITPMMLEEALDYALGTAART